MKNDQNEMAKNSKSGLAEDNLLYAALKISRNIGILSKLRHFVPPKTLSGFTIL